MRKQLLNLQSFNNLSIDEMQQIEGGGVIFGVTTGLLTVATVLSDFRIITERISIRKRKKTFLDVRI